MIFFKIGAAIVILVFAIGNITVFAKSVQLSDNIVTLETDIQKVKKENVELEKKLYSQNSMENLEIMAKQLGFLKQAGPISLDDQHYALAR